MSRLQDRAVRELGLGDVIVHRERDVQIIDIEEAKTISGRRSRVLTIARENVVSQLYFFLDEYVQRREG